MLNRQVRLMAWRTSFTLVGARLSGTSVDACMDSYPNWSLLVNVLVTSTHKQNGRAAIGSTFPVVPQSCFVPQEGESTVVRQGQPFDIVPATGVGC